MKHSNIEKISSKKLLTKIQEIYEMIPKSKCKEGCADCCNDMIQVAPEENKRMGGYEWLGKCNFLKDNRCSIYDNRAFICRLYGTSEILRCENCIPERYLTESETKKLVSEYVKIKNQQENTF